jgi:flagellin
MSISLQTNIDSLVGEQNLNATEAFQSTTIQQLTSGYRINSAADDAAGLAVANGFRSSEAELTQGVQNANNATSTLQIADGGMNNISQMLDTLRSLSTESASGTFTGDRTILNNEFQSLLTEVNQQSQAVGLNTGGQFATDLAVYIGGGKDTQTGGFSASNGTLNINLSAATVDTQSLGLTGFQATGKATTDLSAASTSSVSNILANTANTTAAAGYTTFDFSGPGFSDGGQAQVSVNLQGVTDVGTLVTALNSAIATTGTGASAQDTAFQNAGIIASVSTNAAGAQSLAFTSSNTAFQVQAGDNMANALLGNISTGSTGVSIASTTTGLAAPAGTTAFTPTGVNFEISGGGMTSPVVLNLSGTDTTVGAAVTDITNQVANNTALQAAGITVSQAASTDPLVFTNAKGDTMNVQVSGDTAGALGFGAFMSSGSASTASSTSYVANTADANTLFTGPVVGGTANLGFSFNGASADTTTGAAATELAITVTAAESAQSVADSINSGIAGSTTLQAAGLNATVSGNVITVASANGTSFQLSTAGSTQDIGFGASVAATAVAFAGNTASTAKSTYVDAQGVSNSTAMSFAPIAFGGASQAITLAANSTDGTLESNTITLNSTNAQSIDQAVAYLNQKLQVSNNPTLQSIVAVKEDSSGTEKINFISSNTSFNVSVGASPNAQGISGTVNGNAVAGATTQSATLGTGTTVSIDTQANAIQAVTALASAVTKLGSAQAAVGTGENQLNYAIGLAQSQITNFTAAESRIRDADVAADAANLTKAQTLQQAGIAALSQANSEGQAVLHLLQ